MIMKKTYNFIKVFVAAILLSSLTFINAQTVNVFTDEVSTLPSAIHNSSDWEGLNTTKGIEKDADGDYVFGNWRGAVRLSDPITSWAVNDTVIISVKLKFKNVVKMTKDGMAFFGLLDTSKLVVKDLGWAKVYEAPSTSGETDDAVSFKLNQADTPDPDGKMRTSLVFGSNWGDYQMVDIGLSGVGSAAVAYSDTLEYVYKLVKSSDQDSLFVSLKVKNTSNETDILDMPYIKIKQSTIYDAEGLSFFVYSNKKDVTNNVAALSFKVDKTIDNQPKTEVQLLNSNGTFETGDTTGWIIPSTASYNIVSEAANKAFDSESAYGLKIATTNAEKVDGLLISGFNLEIGETYTVDMRVKAQDISSYTANEILKVMLMPADSWNDKFKETLTQNVSWGFPQNGEWQRMTMTFKVDSAVKNDVKYPFKEGANIGDMISSKLVFQSVKEDEPLTLYIDDVRIYKGDVVEEATSEFIEPKTSPTGLVKTVSSMFRIYPNPANNVLNISTTVERGMIYSLNGKLLKSVMNTNTIDISDLSAGMYLLRADESIVKFVKE